MIVSSPCDSSRLERYLNGETGQAEQQAVEKHLNCCEVCRQQIEQLAADRDFWSAASDCLQPMKSGKDRSNKSSRPGRTTLFAGWSSVALSAPLSLIGKPSGARGQPTTVANSEGSTWDSEFFLRDWLAPLPEDLDFSVHCEAPIGLLGKYQILGVISHGGMGLVLKALDPDLGRTVAIKTLLHHLATSREARQRFIREAKTVASLQHRHIVSIYSVDSWREIPYLVMPYLEEGTLHNLATSRKLDLDEVLAVACQVTEGLAVAHARGLVHRDVKPSNVLLQRGLSEVVLSDFGLARELQDSARTQSMLLAGTPQFMSPEQVLGYPLDTRSDLFSLGSLIYWLVSGQSPFASSTCYATLNNIAQNQYRPLRELNPDVPAWLERLIERLLQKAPDQRIQTADELRNLLDTCRDHLQNPRLHALPATLRPAADWGSTALRGSVGLAAFALITIAICLKPWQTTTFNGSAVSESPFEIVQSGHAASASTDAPTKPELSDSDSTQQPPYANRRGPLDSLDATNLRHDIDRQRNTHYWLRRLASLESVQIPAEAVPWAMALAKSEDARLRDLANIILEKNPFEVIESP